MLSLRNVVLIAGITACVIWTAYVAHLAVSH